MPARPPKLDQDPVKIAANELAKAADTDVFFYNSEIGRPLDDRIIADCCKRKRRPNVTLFLVTAGGDPDAAYRIARCFQDHYKKFICMVPGYCKSAGTLILTGGHELVMADGGELGPLDVQMTKKDELWESESGLTVMSALDALREKSFSAFEHYFMTVKTKSGNRITFRTAAELSVKLTTGLFTPIFQQIDPMHVGEASRSQAIGSHYAMRLSYYGMNISAESLQSLISDYPSHGFVIDREEAKGLFRNVRVPNKEEQNLIDALGNKAIDPLEKTQAIRIFLSDEKGEEHVAAADASGDSAGKPGPRRVAPKAGEGPEREAVVGRPATASG